MHPWQFAVTHIHSWVEWALFFFPLDQESTSLTNSPLQLRIVTSNYHLSKRHVRSQKENVQSKLFCVRFVNFYLNSMNVQFPFLTLGLSEISS